jgi:hypothetical protein
LGSSGLLDLLGLTLDNWTFGQLDISVIQRIWKKRKLIDTGFLTDFSGFEFSWFLLDLGFGFFGSLDFVSFSI